MKINTTNKTIVMTKKEAKAASMFGTAEYYNLVEAMKAFPKFKVETNSAKRTTKDKGLTYDFMREYISSHDDEQKSVMKKFEDLTATSAEAKVLNKKPSSYTAVKKWFLETYEEFDAFEAKRENIMRASKVSSSKVINLVA